MGLVKNVANRQRNQKTNEYVVDKVEDVMDEG